MSTPRYPNARLTDQHAMTIIIVGTLPKGDINPQLGALLADVEEALRKHFPDFLPAHPPCTINVSQLAMEGGE